MSGVVLLGGGKLDGQANLAQDASVQSLITALNKLVAAIAVDGQTTMPTSGLTLMLRGGDGKPYQPAAIATGDGTTQLEVYLGGGSAQATRNTTPGTGMLQVGWPDSSGHLNGPAMDTAGNLNLQSSGADGSPVPAKTMAVGGTDGANLQTLSVNALGALLSQAMAAAGATAPSVFDVIGGLDNNGLTRAANINPAGAVSINDASDVPESPLSLNKTAWTATTATNPPGEITVTTSSSLLLPDSTGSSAINGPRSQLEICNGGNVDVWVSPSLQTVVGCLWVIRPGGSLIEAYSGPVSVITDNTVDGQALPVGETPSAKVSVAEW